jgi:hypothetical protein
MACADGCSNGARIPVSRFATPVLPQQNQKPQVPHGNEGRAMTVRFCDTDPRSEAQVRSPHTIAAGCDTGSGQPGACDAPAQMHVNVNRSLPIFGRR